MLTKRTNILFDDQLMLQMQALARQNGVSIGQLVRDAVIKTYGVSDDIKRRQKALKIIRSIRKFSKNRIDYKELINAGRKY